MSSSSVGEGNGPGPNKKRSSAVGESEGGGQGRGAFAARRPLCFATTLLGRFDVVSSRCSEMLRICDDFLALIKARVQVEESYAKALSKVGRMKIGADTGGSGAAADNLDSPEVTITTSSTHTTSSDAIESLKTDLVNKCVQHRGFAESLMSDVHEPVFVFRNKLCIHTKQLTQKYGKLRKELATMDDRYRKSHQRYERLYREAAMSAAGASEAGADMPELTSAWLATMADRRGGPARSSDGAAAMGGDDAVDATSSPPSSSATEKRKMVAAKMTNMANKSKASVSKNIPKGARDGLVGWLLPTEQQRKTHLSANAQQALEQAELARRTCRCNWEALQALNSRHIGDAQAILTEMQAWEEQRIAELKAALHKHAVFESSCLSNQQYDVQMLSRIFGDICPADDLAAFLSVPPTGHGPHTSPVHVPPAVLPAPPQDSILVVPTSGAAGAPLETAAVVAPAVVLTARDLPGEDSPPSDTEGEGDMPASPKRGFYVVEAARVQEALDGLSSTHPRLSRLSIDDDDDDDDDGSSSSGNVGNDGDEGEGGEEQKEIMDEAANPDGKIVEEENNQV